MHEILQDDEEAAQLLEELLNDCPSLVDSAGDVAVVAEPNMIPNSEKTLGGDAASDAVGKLSYIISSVKSTTQPAM